MSKIENLKPLEDAKRHEDECRAAAINATFVRCRQNGRGFFTTEDARASDLMTRALMQLQPVGEGLREGAPQTMPRHTEVVAFNAVETALRPPRDEDKGAA